MKAKVRWMWYSGASDEENGCEILFLTNAAGGVNENFHADLMMITDQISSFVLSPLIGANRRRSGTAFSI